MMQRSDRMLPVVPAGPTRPEATKRAAGAGQRAAVPHRLLALVARCQCWRWG